MNSPTSQPDWNRVQELFEACLERTPDERERLLARAAGDDPRLRLEVESLLRSDAAGSSFLAGSLPAVMEGTAADDALPGSEFGAYRVHDVLGQGGMGTVYRATRVGDGYQQDIALKVVRSGHRASDVLARFRVERRILAQLNHPNISRLVDGGTLPDGRPYLAMEFVDGDPIDRHCDLQSRNVRERINLFRDACTAVDAAHRSLVIHRDLKPSNLLVTQNGDVKLLDFGIAKVVDPEVSDEEHTADVGRRMTLRYASPEQIRGAALGVSTDVYSLGVMLYELLTGRRPYALGPDSRHRAEQIICESTPERPSSVVLQAATDGTAASETTTSSEEIARCRSTLPRDLARELDGDLEIILLKALHKDPARRYASAERLAEDLRCFVEGLPISARPDSTWYRTQKFVGRHRWSVGLAVLSVSILIAALVTTSTLYGDAESARAKEETQRKRAVSQAAVAQTMNEFLLDSIEAIDPDLAQGRDVGVLVDLTTQIRARLDEPRGVPTDVATSLHQLLGIVAMKLGNYEEAETHFTKCRAMSHQLPSSDWLARADASRHAASVAYLTGAYDEAVRLVQEGLSYVQPSTDAEASLEFVLSEIYAATSEWNEAERLLRKNLAFHEERGDAISVAAAWSALALISEKQGDYEQAWEEAETALDIGRTALSVLHPRLSGQLHNVAWTSHKSGRTERAHEAALEALAIRRHVWPDGHPRTASTLQLLGDISHRAGRLEEGSAFNAQALQVYRTTLGSHELTATAINSQAHQLAEAGHHEKAIPLYLEAEEMYELTLGADHAWTATARSNRAQSIAKSGHIEEALDLFLDVLERRRSALRVGHPDIAMTTSHVGFCLRQLGRADESAVLLEEELERRKAAFGLEHQDVLTALVDVGMAYFTTGTPDQGIPHFQHASELAETLGLAGRELASHRLNLGLAYLRSGLLEEAEFEFTDAEELLDDDEDTVPGDRALLDKRWDELYRVRDGEGR